MYRLNVSFAVEPHAQQRWLDFMRGTFLPRIGDRGYGRATFSRVISADAADHFTYSLLVELDSMSQWSEFTGPVWEAEYAAVAVPVFADAVLWFITLMKTVE